MGQHSCLSLPLSAVNQHITTPTYLLSGKPQNSENGGHHMAKTVESTEVTTNGSHVQNSHPSTVNPTQNVSQTLLDNTDEQTISVTRQGETITEDDVPSTAQNVCDRSQKGYNGSHSDTFSTLVMEAQDLMDHITESQMQYLTCFSDQPAIGLVDSLHMVPCLSELVTGEINTLQDSYNRLMQIYKILNMTSSVLPDLLHTEYQLGNKSCITLTKPMTHIISRLQRMQAFLRMMTTYVLLKYDGSCVSPQITTGSRVACTHADFRSTEKVVAAFVAVSRSLRQT